MNKKGFSSGELAAMSPQEFRSLIRRGEWTEPTIMACRGFQQANLAVVPKDYAFEFFLFCQRNPRPCPVIDVTEPGDPHPKLVAPEADLRTDLPKYRVFQDGKVIAEPTDVREYWRDDLVGFVIGCSVSFDWALRDAKIRFRFPGAYTTNIQCVPAGRLHGPMCVSARLMKSSYDAVRVVQISSRHLLSHGPPVHIGDPSLIGIKDLCHPDMFTTGPIAPQEPGEIAMFWGCGITPQTVALESNIPFMITHGGGHMFVTDKLSEELAIL